MPRPSKDAIDLANAEVLSRITESDPYLVDIIPAGEIVSGLGAFELLHAGPPLNGWNEARTVGALRGSILGSILHLGWAESLSDAEKLMTSGKVTLRSANDSGGGGTYAGVISRTTPVLVVENRTANIRAFAAINEGRGKALRYGANDPETLERLKWIEGELADVLGLAIRRAGGINLRNILSQALHMGDDGHSRQKAASSLILNTLAPHIAVSASSDTSSERVLSFMAANDIFFLPLTIGVAKSTMTAATGVANSTIVTCMAANGVRFGIKISSLPDKWFTTPVPNVTGKFFKGYDLSDANPVIGDSEISETMGLGAFAMAAAPALAAYVGGTPEEATRLAVEMYDITLTEHTRFNVPQLNYRGTPTGIDLLKVVEREITPLFNTGIAHKEPGIGQIGAGFVRTPLSCFRAALSDFDKNGVK